MKPASTGCLPTSVDHCSEEEERRGAGAVGVHHVEFLGHPEGAVASVAGA